MPSRRQLSGDVVSRPDADSTFGTYSSFDLLARPGTDGSGSTRGCNRDGRVIIVGAIQSEP